MFKAILGITLIKGYSVRKAVKKSKQTTNTIIDVLFALSEIVVFFTQGLYKIITTIFKVTVKLFKNIRKGDAVEDRYKNVINLEEYKNKRKAS